MQEVVRFRRSLGAVLLAVTVLLGLAAFVSLGKALGEAVGLAYAAPTESLD